MMREGGVTRFRHGRDWPVLPTVHHTKPDCILMPSRYLTDPDCDLKTQIAEMLFVMQGEESLRRRFATGWDGIEHEVGK